MRVLRREGGNLRATYLPRLEKFLREVKGGSARRALGMQLPAYANSGQCSRQSSFCGLANANDASARLAHGTHTSREKPMLTHQIKTDPLSPVSSATGPVGVLVLFDVKGHGNCAPPNHDYENPIPKGSDHSSSWLSARTVLMTCRAASGL